MMLEVDLCYPVSPGRLLQAGSTANNEKTDPRGGFGFEGTFTMLCRWIQLLALF